MTQASHGRDVTEVASPFPDGELRASIELGAIDSQGLRVWVRQPAVPEISGTLSVAGRRPVTATTYLDAETDWTGALVFRLPEPAPGEPFACQVGGQHFTGRLAPAPGTPAALCFAVGSCHRPFKIEPDGRIGFNSAAGIYPAMLDDLRAAEAAFLLLVGDQMYSDELAPISIRLNLSGDEAHPPPLDLAIDAYRHVCRGYFGQAGFCALRRSLPTYMMWDDHDIFNAWGSRLHETAVDRRLFEAAQRVYCEYQHLRNPAGAISPPPYHYTFSYGDIGFLALDVRGDRDYLRGLLLGQQQWRAVQAFLAGAAAEHLQTLFVISSIPVVHTARWVGLLFSRLHEPVAAAVRDRWCSDAFIQARDELLDRLLAWQAARPRRQVFILSGDVHVASAFTIRERRGPGLIQQLTSSAISTPHTLLHQLLNRAITRGVNLFERRFRFQRHFLGFENNFARLHLQPMPDGGHRVEYLVRGWQPQAQRLRTVARLVYTPEHGPH